MINIALKEKKVFELMFPANNEFHGNIHFATKNKNGFKNMGYVDINNVINKISKLKFHDNADYYFTANTTKTGKRDSENVFSYNNIVIDIDCHKKNISHFYLNETIEEFLYRINRDLYDTEIIPKHNILVKTGRGIQLWWCISQIPGELVWLYNNAQKYLIKAIKDLLNEYSELDLLEVDESTSIKKIGFYRMPSTINTKTKTIVETEILRESRYDINDLILYFPEDEFIEEEKEKTVVFDETYSSLHKKRIEIIENLLAKKSEEKILKGYRNNYLWLYYNACFQAYSESLADKMLDELNALFLLPLKNSQVRSIKKYIKNKKGLQMKQSTFFELLGEEPINKTRAMEREEKRRNKKERNKKIIELYKLGKSVKEICLELKISKPTVLKILKIKELKKDRKVEIIELRKKGIGINEIAEKLKVSISTIRRVLKEIGGVAKNKNKKESRNKKETYKNITNRIKLNIGKISKKGGDDKVVITPNFDVSKSKKNAQYILVLYPP